MHTAHRALPALISEALIYRLLMQKPAREHLLFTALPDTQLDVLKEL
jgi:hypothetical protein